MSILLINSNLNNFIMPLIKLELPEQNLTNKE